MPVHKGTGLAQLARYLGLERGQIMAVGDSGNDLPRLRAVGWPVVPRSGEPDALALARYVTADNDHNPLTQAVRELFAG